MRQLLALLWLILPSLAMAQSTPKWTLCVQDFASPENQSSAEPTDCNATGIPADQLQSIKTELDIIIANAAPETAGLLTGAYTLGSAAPVVSIYIIPKDLVTTGAPTGASHAAYVAVDAQHSLGWIWWNTPYSKIDIGISEIAFEEQFSIEDLETTKLLQLFWSPVSGPPRFDPSVMPYFSSFAATGNLNSQELAAYDILAHEIGHFWFSYLNAANSGSTPYAGQTSDQTACSSCLLLSAGTFAQYSWTSYMPEPAQFDPPWLPSGVWGWAGATSATNNGAQINPNQTTLYLNRLLKSSVVKLPDDGVRAWNTTPPPLKTFLGCLYNNGPSGNGTACDIAFPTALAATSPEEDFAETYTMLELNQAGLSSLCLSYPAAFTNPIDIMQQLFPGSSSATTFQNKLAWFVAKKSSFGAGATFATSTIPPNATSCQ